jgi:hypothetical protein
MVLSTGATTFKRFQLHAAGQRHTMSYDACMYRESQSTESLSRVATSYEEVHGERLRTCARHTAGGLHTPSASPLSLLQPARISSC